MAMPPTSGMPEGRARDVVPLPMSASPIATIRERLVALAAARARGEIDDETYEAQRRTAERALGDAVLAAPMRASSAASSDASAASAPTPVASSLAAPARPSTRLVVGLVALVTLIAVGGYAYTGSPSLAGLGKPPVVPSSAQATAPDGSEREVGLQQIAAMVDKLATRLKEKPDDAEGWTMLARSYTVLSRYRDALPAYQHAIALRPKDAGLLADYSDAIAAANDGKPNAESLALIDRALAIDPTQPKALALAGTVAFERGDFATAARQWQKIADALPPGSAFHQQVMANVDEARRRGGLPPASTAAASSPAATAGSATGSPTASASASQPASRADPSRPSSGVAGNGTLGAAAAGSASGATAAPGREAVSGTVSLAPSLARDAAPDDTVFVLARPVSGRMPLAVFRATVRELPLRFVLDDRMAMTPTMKISDMKELVVTARVSRSGNAITQPGDLAGESAPVAPGTHDLAIVIDHAVPAR